MKMKKQSKFVTVMTLICCMVLSCFPTMKVNATTSYTLTFTANNGYTLSPQGSDGMIKVSDGTNTNILEVRDSSNSSPVGRVVDAGNNTVTVTVDSTVTSVCLSFNSGAFSVYKDGSKVNLDVTFNADTTFNVQAPEQGGNPSSNIVLTFEADTGYTLTAGDGAGKVNVSDGTNRTTLQVVNPNKDNASVGTVSDKGSNRIEVVVDTSITNAPVVTFDGSKVSISMDGANYTGTSITSSKVLFVKAPQQTPSSNVEVTVNATATSGKFGAITVNGVNYVSGAETATVSDTKQVEEKIQDTIVVLAEFGSKITELKINGASMDLTGVTDKATYVLNHESTYTIEMSCGTNTSISNIVWDYTGEKFGNDALVEHGTVEIISATLPNSGGTLTVEQLKVNASKNDPNLPQLEVGDKFGKIQVPSGTVVTLKIVPDYGYQVASTTLNDVAVLVPDDGTIAQYTINVSGMSHLKGLISKVEDAVNSETTKVETGSITLGGTETAISNGTARLDVADITLNASQVAKFEEAAGDYDVKDYLDISLYQTIYKGSAADVWDTQVKELSNSATITLQLEENVNGNDIVIVHEKHDGTYEVIPTTYDAATNTISFQTSSFSNYAIATKTTTGGTEGTGGNEESDGNVENSPNTAEKENSVVVESPKTGDKVSLYALVFVASLSGLIGLFVKNRKIEMK